MTDTIEVIAAFADGERVDADALKQALGESAGRDYLIDLLALREAVESERADATRGAPNAIRPMAVAGRGCCTLRHRGRRLPHRQLCRSPADTQSHRQTRTRPRLARELRRQARQAQERSHEESNRGGGDRVQCCRGGGGSKAGGQCAGPCRLHPIRSRERGQHKGDVDDRHRPRAGDADGGAIHREAVAVRGRSRRPFREAAAAPGRHPVSDKARRGIAGRERRRLFGSPDFAAPARRRRAGR